MTTPEGNLRRMQYKLAAVEETVVRLSGKDDLAIGDALYAITKAMEAEPPVEKCNRAFEFGKYVVPAVTCCLDPGHRGWHDALDEHGHKVSWSG